VRDEKPALTFAAGTFYDRTMPAGTDRQQPGRDGNECSIREATLSDYEGIQAVMIRNGLYAEDYPSWSRVWTENPFRREIPIPMGWVLEHSHFGIVGTFSNVPRLYTLHDERVRVAVARAWGVDPQFRSQSIFLAAKFFSQPDVDLFLDTTASSEAGAVFKAFKCRQIPGPAANYMLFWITNYAGFAGSMLKKKKIPDLWGLRVAAGAALRCADFALRPKAHPGKRVVCLLSRFDERMDEIWDVLRSRHDRLLAVRSRDALEWQLGPTLQSGETVVFGALEGNRLSGYLILRRYDAENLGLTRFRVVDMQAVEDEEDAILSLMSAAIDYSKRAGVYVLEAMGFHESKHKLLECLGPLRRLLPSYPFLYGVNSRAEQLGIALKNADSWDPSPFDGDAAL